MYSCNVYISNFVNPLNLVFESFWLSHSELYCHASTSEDLRSAPQNSDKNQAHICNPRAGVWEKQAGSFILPAKAELQTYWETPSQQMTGKTIHERDQISTPGFHTLTQ